MNSGDNNEKIIINKNEELLNILVIDCGIKNSQLRALLKHNIQLTVVNLNYRFADEVLDKQYHGIFISNGPGDPKYSVNAIQELKKIFNSNIEIPIFGICFGHQLIALANDFDVTKMRYGNRGHNIPCNLVNTEKCFITSQNHGYEVNYSEDKVNEWMELFTNCNDGSNEGLIHLHKPYFSVQFHPEARADQLILHFYLIYL